MSSQRIGVGVCILPERPWREASELWRQAEDLGFDHAWTYDHLTWGGLPNSPWYAAFPTLAAAAAVTSRIGLGTFVASPNTHHPLQLVREALSLHDLSAGRFLLGIGAGGDLDASLSAPGLSTAQRSARFREFAAVVADSLRHDGLDHAGEHYQFEGAGSLPGPPNAGLEANLPLLIAANGPRALATAAAHGHGWITYGGRAESDQAWWQLIADVAQRMDEAVAASRRTRPLRRILGLDSAPTYPFSGVDRFEDALGRALECGFTDVVCTWPRPTNPYAGSMSTVQEVAARLF